ncbi:MAG: NAD(+) synthase, partial [Dehalococcoidales bacterium]|nr:NAD(+) synthase [Dehalococcoidales bacterium]
MDTRELTDRLVLWIRDRVTAAGCGGVLLGMSGGIDSSVIAVLCQRACPGNTLGILMPCYSCQEDEDHALAVAGKFGITTKTIALDSIFDSLVKLLPASGVDASATRLAQANLKVRLRMVILYYLANQMRFLVVGSSNRSELTLGYFTKYGDGGVDIMPLGNLVKQQVRELASCLGIPEVIIDKPPSAGLWPGQTDEAEMGLSYAELDRYLLTGEAGSEV